MSNYKISLTLNSKNIDATLILQLFPVFNTTILTLLTLKIYLLESTQILMQ